MSEDQRTEPKYTHQRQAAAPKPSAAVTPPRSPASPPSAAATATTDSPSTINVNRPYLSAMWAALKALPWYAITATGGVAMSTTMPSAQRAYCAGAGTTADASHTAAPAASPAAYRVANALAAVS